jgi:thiol-disulfide isomerase/thioredoxin
MQSPPMRTPTPARSRRKAWIALVGVAGLMAAVPLLRRLARPPLPGATLEFHPQPRALPALLFSDGSGRPVDLTDFQDRVVLLNLWATWCPPCREEMPTLDRLQASIGGASFEVVALSIDSGGLPVVRSYYERNGLRSLQAYVDVSGAALPGLGAAGVPLTLLIDRSGRELARRLGPAVWDDPQVVEQIRQQIGASGPALG